MLAGLKSSCLHEQIQLSFDRAAEASKLRAGTMIEALFELENLARTKNSPSCGAMLSPLCTISCCRKPVYLGLAVHGSGLAALDWQLAGYTLGLAACTFQLAAPSLKLPPNAHRQPSGRPPALVIDHYLFLCRALIPVPIPIPILARRQSPPLPLPPLLLPLPLALGPPVPIL